MINQFTEEDINLIIVLANQLTGSKVNAKQHSVIIQNVYNRMLEAKCHCLEQYLELVNSSNNEMPYLLSALTIHTTSWFRESSAMNFLHSFLKKHHGKFRVGNPLRILSVACSTGEEVYSLAGIANAIAIQHPGFSFYIEGWDIDPISLRTAIKGEYDGRAASTIPSEFSNFFSVVSGSNHILISDVIKEKCRFKAVNIVDPPKEVVAFDFIFCRNMLIYFETQIIDRIVSYLHSKMNREGFLCLGVSETSAASKRLFLGVEGAVFQPHLHVRPNDQQRSLSSSSLDSKFPTPTLDNRNSKILIVDDEPFILDIMEEVLGGIGHKIIRATTAAEALEQVRSNNVSLVLSDYRMPGEDGIWLCNKVRAQGFKGRFIIISGHADQLMTKRASEAKCDDVVLKPCIGKDLERLVGHYLGTNVVSQVSNIESYDLVLLGASTGGTEALARVLVNLPSSMPPVIYVQHIAPNFSKDFATRLSRISGLKLGAMTAGEPLKSGHLYTSFGDYHIGLKKSGSQVVLATNHDGPVSGHRPSVDYLFASASDIKANIFAAILTGMGRDGADGLKSLRQKGAMTVAQDEQSCVVFGMPKEAIQRGAAVKTCNLDEISDLIQEIASDARAKKSA